MEKDRKRNKRRIRKERETEDMRTGRNWPFYLYLNATQLREESVLRRKSMINSF
jgi:hypothetical protein